MFSNVSTSNGTRPECSSDVSPLWLRGGAIQPVLQHVSETRTSKGSNVVMVVLDGLCNNVQ